MKRSVRSVEILFAAALCCNFACAQVIPTAAPTTNAGSGSSHDRGFGGGPSRPADQPVARNDRNSQIAHERLLEKARKGGIDVYFIGDSITRRWGATDYPELLANWNRNFFGWNAANFGWGADSIENMLWRLENGELEGVNPKIIVVLAGINNVGTVPGDDAKVENITRGLKALVNTCRRKAPNATFILTALFPRNDNMAVIPTINRINENLAKMADGKKIRYLNVNDKLADKDGKLFEGMSRDALHPTLKAYQIWADGLKPIFSEILGPPAKTDHAPPPTGDPSAKPRQATAAADVKEDPGRWLGRWTLKTVDTTLTLGVRSDQKLHLCKLASPAGWNWVNVPSPFPLVSHADIGDKPYELKWRFQKGVEDHAEGSRVTISFTNADPALLLTSTWQARRGPGPVRHTMFIRNQASRKVTLHTQESLDVEVAGPAGDISVWYVNDDGSLPDKTGVYHDALAAGYRKLLRFSEDQDFIPITFVDAQNKHGLYVGWEWSIGRMAIAAHPGPAAAAIKAGSGDDFKTDLEPGETFEVPPGFIGAYQGDLDDAGNSLRKYLFNYSMPAILKDDPGYPKVEWNAFAATGKGQGSWTSTETKYYPLIDEIAPLGFEEVVLDIGWWEGDTTHKPHPPVGSGTNWPSGMLAARNYAHDKGMRFGLYWNCNPSMTTLDGIKHRQEDAHSLYEQFRIDFFRSDGTDGNVLQTGGYCQGARAHYAGDVGYWQTKGYYQVLDSLYASITNFSYENCSGGGRIKDYGILKRCMKIQSQDRYYPLDARQSFYDSSFALHPMQIAALCGSWAEWQAAGSVYEFRSSSMGAPYWHPDAPGGRNGGPLWTAAQSAWIKEAVDTYKTMIRPLVRTANLYHIFPRPTGKIWDGIEYFDPVSRKGAVFVFRPDSPEATQTIRLKGLERKAKYWLWCADGPFALTQIRGEDLIKSGLTLSLPRTNSSEIVFLQDARLGKPATLSKPKKPI